MACMRTLTVANARSTFAFCRLPFAFWFVFSFPFAASSPKLPAQRLASLRKTTGMSRAVVQLLAVGPANQEQNQECAATGFLINEDGYLITNAHVVEAAKGCLEKAPGAKILAKLTITDARTAQAVPCEVIGIDAPNDLALLKTERPLLANPAASRLMRRSTGAPWRWEQQ